MLRNAPRVSFAMIVALASAGAFVTLSYRKKQFSRPKPDNVDMLKRLEANPAASVAVTRITALRLGAISGGTVQSMVWVWCSEPSDSITSTLVGSSASRSVLRPAP